MDGGMDMTPPGAPGVDSHSGHSGEEMHMAFYWDKAVQLMFSGWSSNTIAKYLLSLAALFVLAFFHQALIHIRAYILDPKELRDGQKAGVGILERRPVVRSALQTAGFACNAASGYLLMLAVMSYNVGVFLVIIGGLSLGFFLFSLRGRKLAPTVEAGA